MEKAKVALTYMDVEENYAVETVWAQKVGDHYKIDNIPFYAPNIAFGDIVSVEEDDGQLHFEDIITCSGHSTIQIIFFKKEEAKRVLLKLEALKCEWEEFNEQYYSLDVGPQIEYTVIKNFLDQEYDRGNLDYKEACLSDFHKY